MSKVNKKAWYYHKTANDEYYTNSCNLKKRRHLIGPGERPPTPAEIFDFLNLHPDAEIDDLGLLGYEYAKEDADQKPKKLPGGFYRHESKSYTYPERFVPMEVRGDTIINLPEVFNPILADIKSFISEESKKIDKELNIQHKLGIMLYGPPGTGKTTLIRSVLKNTIPSDAIVIFMESLFSNKMISTILAAESDRLKVIVFEEMLTAVENIKLDVLLDFLDGERSLDNVLVIGTTNYPERLPANIVDRPGRFDRLYKIGHPNKNNRQLLINFYLGRAATQDEVKITDGMSVASIKEICLIMRRMNKNMEEASAQIKKHRDLVKNEFSEARPLGIGSRSGSMFEDDEDF